MSGMAGAHGPARSSGVSSTSPLRVVVVMPLGHSLGGGEEMLRQLLREGRDTGVEWIMVFLRDGPLVGETRDLGIRCHVIESGRFRNVLRRLQCVRRIAALIRAERADLCVGWMVAGQAMAGPAALLAGVRCAWYQVGTPRPDLLDRFATLWPAAGVLTLSRAGAEAQSRIRPRRSVSLVHPGVSMTAVERTRALNARELRMRIGLPADGPLIGTVARLQRWKGVHVFLDAVAIARRTYPELRAVVVGGPHETEPDYARELKERAVRLGIEGAVTFAGFQANAIEWMQAMDLVVHTADREPFGIVVVEAMALGKPVIAGAEGGPTEIITPGVDGLLVPYGDAAGLARAVGRLIADPHFAGQVGASARQRAASFSDRAYALKVIAALRGFAGGAP